MLISFLFILKINRHNGSITHVNQQSFDWSTFLKPIHKEVTALIVLDLSAAFDYEIHLDVVLDVVQEQYSVKGRVPCRKDSYLSNRTCTVITLV